MEGETETQARRTQTVRKHVKLFLSCSSFFTLLCLPCIPSISIVRICYKLQLLARSEGGLLLRNAMISSHIWSKFPSTYFKSATFRKSSFGGPIQFQPGRDGILNTSHPLSPPPPSPHLSPHSPFLTCILSFHPQWLLRDSSGSAISSFGALDTVVLTINHAHFRNISKR